SLSSNVPPWLMRRLVQTELWPLSRALRVIDRMLDDEERASALSVLVGVLEVAEQRKVLGRAMDLSEGYRTRALAWMIPDLAGVHQEEAFEAAIVDLALFDWQSLINLNHVAESLPLNLARRLLTAARSIVESDIRLRALSAIAESARSLPVEDRKAV